MTDTIKLMAMTKIKTCRLKVAELDERDSFNDTRVEAQVLSTVIVEVKEHGEVVFESPIGGFGCEICLAYGAVLVPAQ